MLPKEDTILQLYARAPAPCRDYCGLTIGVEQLILNVWNVTHGPHVYPKRQTCPVDVFEENKPFQLEVQRLFGHHVHRHLLALARNQLNLETVPAKVFHRLLNYLSCKDVRNLSQTSKILFERCNTEDFWFLFFKKRLRRKPDQQDRLAAEKFGWRDALKTKLLSDVFKKKTKPPAPAKTLRNLNITQRAAEKIKSSSNPILPPRKPQDSKIKTSKSDASRPLGAPSRNKPKLLAAKK